MIAIVTVTAITAVAMWAWAWRLVRRNQSNALITARVEYRLPGPTEHKPDRP